MADAAISNRTGPVLTYWKECFFRARRLTWDEAQTRATQAIRQRIELAKFVLDLPIAPPPVKLSRAPSDAFFFSKGDLPGIAAALKHMLPAEATGILTTADDICKHRFQLLGYKDVEYGPKIDWHFDAVNRKRSPYLPWFKIPFLDFSVVGDHKVIWELNRHQHLVTLAKAWVLSRDSKYAEELIRQWYSWQRGNRFPIGINWSSTLEVALRSLSWLWAHFLLSDYNAPAFERDVVKALGLNASYIQNYLSTYFSPNTHLLGEAAALFFIGTLYPQLNLAKEWQACGLRIILEQAERQVREDGLYFEQSLYYHVYALDLLLHFRVLAAKNRIEVPERFDSTVNQMLDVLSVLSQAGPPEGFGDDDGGRLFNPSRNRSEYLTDPLAVGAMAFESEDLRSRSQLTEEALWLFGPDASKLPHRPQHEEIKSVGFPAGGVYVLASSAPYPRQMIMDAGSMGAGRGGHGHADALSVCVSLDGRRYLIDSGTYTYSSAGNERDRFRGTAAHNTLLVDGEDQALPNGPFAWRAMPGIRTERWLPSRTFSLLQAHHTGYMRLADPVLHRRVVFHLHESFWFVRDIVEGAGTHDLEISWHFAPELTIASDENSCFVSLHDLNETFTDARQLALVFPESSGWEPTLEATEISPAYGVKEPAQVLRVRTSCGLPTEFATLILALEPLCGKPGALESISAERNRIASGYRYEDQGTIHFMFFSSGQHRWSLAGWESDAAFLYCSTRNGEAEHLILCDGSFVDSDGRSVLKRHHNIERLEWSKSGIVSSSDDPEIRLTSFSSPVLR